MPSYTPGADWKCCGEKIQSFTTAELKEFGKVSVSVSTLQKTAPKHATLTSLKYFHYLLIEIVTGKNNKYQIQFKLDL